MTIPDEAVQAAHAEYHKVLGDSNRSNPMLAALTAALPFLTGVKELEEENKSLTEEWYRGLRVQQKISDRAETAETQLAAAKKALAYIVKQWPDTSAAKTALAALENRR